MTASNETIARKAYEIWEAEGRPEGKEQEHWIRAETQVRDEQGGAKSARPRRAVAKESLQPPSTRAPRGTQRA